MIYISTALAPILVLIVLGFVLKQSGFLPEATWAGLEKLTYFILFPALLIRILGSQSLEGTPWRSMLMVVAGTLLVAATILIVWYKFRGTVSGPTFTSIFQGGVRFNTYITLSVAQSFFGPDGLTLAAVVAGFMIVLINFLIISAFVVWGSSTQNSVKSFFQEIVKNPLIIGSMIGWFLSLSNIGLPGITGDILKIVGQAALPFGLMAVGAALNLKALHGHVRSITISSMIQFGIKPVTAALLISVTGLNGVAAGVLVIALMTPTAPSGCILARQLGGDVETMSSIVTFQTIFAFLAMPMVAMMMLQ
ncbi:MAG TPA: AEC family transporter [Desulfocapsa sulfexigens]|nr:AEC family transporter [Desulfocapsa sulfexigens]